jgi:hypothetical protein
MVARWRPFVGRNESVRPFQPLHPDTEDDFLSKLIIIDDLHITFRVPEDLPEAVLKAVRRILAGDPFLDRLGRGVREVVQEFPELNTCRVSLTR